MTQAAQPLKGSQVPPPSTDTSAPPWRSAAAVCRGAAAVQIEPGSGAAVISAHVLQEAHVDTITRPRRSQAKPPPDYYITRRLRHRPVHNRRSLLGPHRASAARCTSDAATPTRPARPDQGTGPPSGPCLNSSSNFRYFLAIARYLLAGDVSTLRGETRPLLQRSVRVGGCSGGSEVFLVAG